MAFKTITFEAWVERNDYGLEGRLVLDDPPSRYLLDRFTMQRGPESEEPITATGIRSVPIDFVINQVLANFGVQAEADWVPRRWVCLTPAWTRGRVGAPHWGGRGLPGERSARSAPVGENGGIPGLFDTDRQSMGVAAPPKTLVCSRWRAG